jgi:hypothetical protein
MSLCIFSPVTLKSLELSKTFELARTRSLALELFSSFPLGSSLSFFSCHDVVKPGQSVNMSSLNARRDIMNDSIPAPTTKDPAQTRPNVFPKPMLKQKIICFLTFF